MPRRAPGLFDKRANGADGADAKKRQPDKVTAQQTGPSMSFFKKEVAKRHHRAGGAALMIVRGVLFHPIGSALTGVQSTPKGNLDGGSTLRRLRWR